MGGRREEERRLEEGGRWCNATACTRKRAMEMISVTRQTQEGG